MKIFKPLYDKVIQWSKHPHSERYLGGVSFIESSFFPIPTVMMLAPMVMARREHAWRLATLATVTSVLGGLFGYLIGYFLFDQVGQHILDFYHLQEKFIKMKGWFDEYGVWLVLLAGVTPIPYKLFTIAAGIFQIDFAIFILASLVSRSARFFIVAGLIYVFGPGIRALIDRYFNIFAVAFTALLIAGFLLIKYLL